MSVAGIGSGAFYTALSGMQQESSRVAEAAGQIAGGDLEPQPAVDMHEAAIGFTADVKVAQTANYMAKTLLDILA